MKERSDPAIFMTQQRLHELKAFADAHGLSGLPKWWHREKRKLSAKLKRLHDEKR